MDYVIGIDGGGTKTAAVVMNCTKNEMRRYAGGALNINGESRENVERHLFELFRQIWSSYPPEGCAGVCIASAGVSNPAARELLSALVKRIGINNTIHLIGDQESALYGALSGAEGAVLIAGTGSICYGRKEDGTFARTGGYGHLVDDEGSAYAIGRDILKAVIRGYDKRASDTIFKRLVFERLSIGRIEELIAFVYAPETNKRDIASLAVLLEEGLQVNDIAAEGIVERCKMELALLAETTLKQLMLPSPRLAFMGSVLRHNDRIRHEAESEIKKRIAAVNCMEAEMDAACGAALYVLDRVE